MLHVVACLNVYEQMDAVAVMCLMSKENENAAIGEIKMFWLIYFWRTTFFLKEIVIIYSMP